MHMQINRRLIKNFDWGTFFIVILLSIIGIMTIYSATRPLLLMNSQIIT